jgi:putative RecB family exonuclease
VFDRDHLSYSSISKYTTCARQWRYKYIDNLPDPPSAALKLGSAVHAVIEELITDRTEQLSAASPATLFAERWGEALADATVRWNSDLPEAIGNEGLRLVTSGVVLDVINKLEPMMVKTKAAIEERVELHVPGVPVPIVGFIDMIGADGVPHDFKTSAFSWNAEKAQAETQPLFYLAALNQAGRVDHGYRFRHVVLVKTKTPQAAVIESQHRPGEMFWLFEMIADVWKGIQAGHFPPSPGAWSCTPKYCNAWDVCRGRA